MRTKQVLIALLICLTVYFAGGVFLLFVKSTQTTTHNCSTICAHNHKENSKSFAIDSVQYHQAGKDNNLQVTPYWMCHLKGTNHLIRVTENKEVGDSLSMIIR